MSLLITPGMGVGPEVTALALKQAPPERSVVLIGRAEPMLAAAEAAELPLVQVDDIRRVEPGQVGLLVPPPGEQPVEVEAIMLAGRACLRGDGVGMVTGPIHKAKLAAQGFTHRGHTDLLGDLCGALPVMAFVGGRLRVALVTTHISLAEVPAAITQGMVEHVVRTVALALRTDLGISAPRIAVCGLNPHAGEDGLLGTEEIQTIGPACDALRREGLHVQGPMSAETAFMSAGLGEVELVVAMYHDQGLVPLKLVDFGRSVNWTLGLPILRTSVDHGTAEGLVGTGRADPASMVAAIELAQKVLSRRLL